ncbi:CorA family divalent cation transporter [Pelistega indica]|uniref:CorA family divalent cation transporter n=1 Tax=Pelistega indica TaxID=1414851 RepID=UPI000410CE35|nr:CorA family divalent cation transporter [Pelistega indica]
MHDNQEGVDRQKLERLKEMHEAQDRIKEAEYELEQAHEQLQQAVDEFTEAHGSEELDDIIDENIEKSFEEGNSDDTGDAQTAISAAIAEAEAGAGKEVPVAKKAKKETGLVASVEYVHGKKREHIPLSKLAGYKKDSSRLLWVGLKDPTEEELLKVCRDLSIIDEAAQEIIQQHRKPKIIDYGNYIQLVAVTITRENKKLVFGEMQMIFGVGFVLTVRRGGAMTNSSLRERMESCPELIARGSDFVVAEILDVFVDSFAALASRLEVEVNQVEQKMMLRGFRETDIRKLYKQRRDLLRIRTSITPMVEICRKIAVMNSPIIEPDSRSYFTVVSDRIARIDEQINALHEALAFAFEASLMIGQSHQTDITKKLAAWAAILAVPTAIAGIYGMNFKFMPELEWQYGYPLARGVDGGYLWFPIL